MTPTIAPNHPQLEMDILIVRGFFEAWAAGDVSRLDLLVDEDVVVAPLLGLLYEREVYRGRSGVAAAFGETAARWHRLELTVPKRGVCDPHVLREGHAYRVGLESERRHPRVGKAVPEEVWRRSICHAIIVRVH